MPTIEICELDGTVDPTIGEVTVFETEIDKTEPRQSTSTSSYLYSCRGKTYKIEGFSDVGHYLRDCVVNGTKRYTVTESAGGCSDPQGVITDQTSDMAPSYSASDAGVIDASEDMHDLGAYDIYYRYTHQDNLNVPRMSAGLFEGSIASHYEDDDTDSPCLDGGHYHEVFDNVYVQSIDKIQCRFGITTVIYDFYAKQPDGSEIGVGGTHGNWGEPLVLGGLLSIPASKNYRWAHMWEDAETGERFTDIEHIENKPITDGKREFHIKLYAVYTKVTDKLLRSGDSICRSCENEKMFYDG